MQMKGRSTHWKEIISSNGILIQDSEYDKLDLYCDLLLEWNQKVNLLSRKDESNIWPGHILHSISVMFEVDLPAKMAVADVGSGGGFPGIPLAILLPSTTVVLIESIKKKCSALTDMVSRLKLGNARIVNARVEDIANSPGFNRTFDLVFARAVAPLKELIIWSTPLANHGFSNEIKLRHSACDSISGPCLVAMKGGDTSVEIREARQILGEKRILETDIQFIGAAEAGLVDKKIIIVSL